MKVLLIKPMEHPQVVDIENSLKEFYRILDCDCITATYPWEADAVALVTDDNGMFTEKPFSRYIPELEQPIKGNFFICGLGEEDFAELPQDLIQRFRERFWVPEAFVSMFGQMAVIQMDDGTSPCRFQTWSALQASPRLQGRHFPCQVWLVLFYAPNTHAR